MNTVEIRKQAKTSIQGKYAKACVIFLIYSVFNILVNLVPFIGQIFAIIMSVPLSYGLIYSMFKLKRNEGVGYFDFITIAFSEFANSWKIAFSIFGKLWPYILGYVGSFVLIIIGSIITYTMAKSAGVVDGSTSNNFGFMIPLILFSVLGIIVGIVCYVSLVLKSLYYSLSYYVFYDNPNATGKEIVVQSKVLMNGHRWDIIKIQIPYYLELIAASFLLCMIVFVIGVIFKTSLFPTLINLMSIIPQLFIMPLIQFAIISFYEKLTGTSNYSDNQNNNYTNDYSSSEQSINYTHVDESKKGFSITSLILGIASMLLFCFSPLALICAIFAIIFGIIGIVKHSKGMGIAGVLTGIIGIVVAVTSYILISSITNDITDKLQEIDRLQESANTYQTSYNELYEDNEKLDDLADSVDKIFANFMANSYSQNTTNTTSSTNNISSGTNSSLTVKDTTIKYTVPSDYKLSNTYTYSTSATNYYNTSDYSISVNCELDSYNSKTAKEYLEDEIKWNTSYKSSGIQSISVNGNTIYYVIFESKSSNRRKIKTAYVLPNNYLYTVSASCYDDDVTLTISTIRDFLKIK